MSSIRCSAFTFANTSCVSRPQPSSGPQQTASQTLLGPGDGWREGWKNTRDGIEIFLGDYQRNGINVHTTDWPNFEAMRGPLRRWSGTVLHFRHEREGALGQLEGYTPMDNDEIAEELWSTRYDWSDTEEESIQDGRSEEDAWRLPKFLPWAERLQIYQTGGKLPLTEE